MASKNMVTLTFAGDHADLEKSFDSIGSSAKDMSGDVDSASKDMSSSFDKAGEASDALDTKAMGFRDTITGVQDSVKGFGSILKGDFSGDALVTAGTGIGDLASGFTNLLIPSMKSAVGWLGKTRVGILAQAAASKVVGAATAVWTGIQAAFNFVMSLNPIVLVIIAIVALVAIVVVAYKKSETFRKIVDAAFKAVGVAVGWLKDRFMDWWNLVRAVFSKAVSLFKGIKGKFRSAFSGLVGVITGPFKTAFNAVSRLWNATIGKLSWTVPGWVPVIGGNTISAPKLPTFHTGGVASGAHGREFLAVLRAGERVVGGSGGGGQVMVLRLDLTGADEDMKRLIRKWITTDSLVVGAAA